jgi:hypothetical protein
MKKYSITSTLNKYLFRIKSVSLYNLLKNFVYLAKYDYKSELRVTQAELSAVNYRLRATQLELLYFKILDYYNNHPSENYHHELFFLKEIGTIALFPYRKIKGLAPLVCGIDPAKGLPYVVHRDNKKLYFPADWSIDQVRDAYISLVEEQGILGGGYYEKAPHQYQTKAFHVKQGDTILDIGAAEGIFALDNIDKARKVYLFESDEMWINALRATFEPYQDRVVLINKFVSDVDSGNQTTLASCVADKSQGEIFIKIDIEGDELKVLNGNKDFFLTGPAIRIACCTYHKNKDAEDIKNIMNDYGYETEFSDGYMIFVHDKNIQPPYFRRGIIRGQRINSKLVTDNV